MAYKLNKGYICQKIDGKITIFDSENSKLITLNETATFIFERLKRRMEKEKIIELLQKKYNVEEKKLESDFKEFIVELKRLKIIS